MEKDAKTNSEQNILEDNSTVEDVRSAIIETLETERAANNS